MKILICFALTENELQRVCKEQRDVIQKQLARSAAIQQKPVPVSTELILISVCRLDDESKIVTLR